MLESRHPAWKPGDRVIHNGWGVGETRWGCLAEQVAQAHRHRVEVQFARLDLAEVEDVVDQRGQVLGRTDQGAGERVALLADAGLRHQFREADDGVERRAYLMAHRRDEGGLGPIGALGRFGERFQFDGLALEGFGSVGEFALARFEFRDVGARAQSAAVACGIGGDAPPLSVAILTLDDAQQIELPRQPQPTPFHAGGVRMIPDAAVPGGFPNVSAAGTRPDGVAVGADGVEECAVDRNDFIVRVKHGHSVRRRLDGGHEPAPFHLRFATGLACGRRLLQQVLPRDNLGRDILTENENPADVPLARTPRSDFPVRPSGRVVGKEEHLGLAVDALAGHAALMRDPPAVG